MDSTTIIARFDALSRNVIAAAPRIPAAVAPLLSEPVQAAFTQGGFTDQTFEPWTPRNPNDHTPPHPLLVKTGRLRNSIHIISITSDSASIGTAVPYASIHNEGGSIPARQAGVKGVSKATSKPTTIPRRQFLGNSHQQTQKIRALIEQTIAAAATK